MSFYTPYGTVYTVAWNKMYRAEVWKLLHYPEGRLHEDDFVAHRLFWRCDKVVCIDKPLYHYRLRNGSICRTSIRPEAFDAVDGLADRYRFYVENHADRTVIDAAYAACWRRYLFLCAKVRQNPTPRAGQGDQQGAVPDAGADQLPAELPQHEDDRKAQRCPLGHDERAELVPNQISPLLCRGRTCPALPPHARAAVFLFKNPPSKEPTLAIRKPDKEKNAPVCCWCRRRTCRSLPCRAARSRPC